MLSLKVHRAAQNDLADVLGYYSAISPDLAEAFLAQFNIAVALLLDRPEVGSTRFAHLFPSINLRTWSLDRFPFRLFYAIRGNSLHLLRVDHERRDVRAGSLKRKPKR